MRWQRQRRSKNILDMKDEQDRRIQNSHVDSIETVRSNPSLVTSRPRRDKFRAIINNPGNGFTTMHLSRDLGIKPSRLSEKKPRLKRTKK